MEIRCEWGEAGLATLRDWAEALVIVDVLSFTTCVSIATARGARVHVISTTQRDKAAALARRLGAILAKRRRDAGPGEISLSPGTLLSLTSGSTLVLPSPNGSALSALAGSTPTFAASFRNLSAVASHLDGRFGRLAVVPGGERWPDGSLRVAIEDWLGAGALISRLSGDRSAEARLAETCFRASVENLPCLLQGSESGRELRGLGFATDVDHALSVDADESVPMLMDGAYRNVAG